MQDVDIVVKADHILTMNDRFEVIEHGAIAVRYGKIMAVGSEADVLAAYRPAKMVGGPDTIAFPGLANTHTHSPMVYFRGLKDDLPLKVWLEGHIWPAENRWLSHEFVLDASELACLEMLKAGITSFCDMYFYGDAIALSAKKAGIRAVIGAGVLDFPSATAQSVEEYLANAERFIRDWTDDDLVIPGVAPHAPYTCSPETMKKAKKLAARYGLPMHLHLAETQWEVQEVLRQYGRTPVALMHHNGLLDEAVIAAHCVWPSDDEIRMLAVTGVNVSHCIESNLKLASGIAPVVKMLEAGVKVSFGTDGAASNNDLDILSEMGTAAKVHKAICGDPTVLNARQVMLMATRSGAEALGLGQQTGSIEAGKAADIVIADLTSPHLLPLYDVYSHIVYSMKSSDISTVMVNGKVLIENRRHTLLDEEVILANARAWGEKIRQTAG